VELASLKMRSYLKPFRRSLGKLLDSETAVDVGSYKYDTISSEDIRIITLQPGNGNEKICISISCQGIAQGDRHPYIAVSYVWGNPRLSKSVDCDGLTLKVTANVFEVLQRLRHAHTATRLWIDAMCINQHDLPERNHQVSLMKSIYSDASQVLIWTGKKDKNTLSVFSWFESVAQEEEEIISRESTKDSFRHVSTFINRPWFHRAWTFQELCLARDAQVLCGTHQLPWDTIAKAFTFLESRGLSQAIFGEVADCMTASSRFYVNSPEREQPYLSIVLPLTRNLQATDPRDKVFAMMGLVDTSQLHGFKPDYTLSVAQVYLNCTRAMIVQEQGLSVFSSAMGQFQGKDLPSWVPDWRLPRRTAYLHGYDWPTVSSFYELNHGSTIQHHFKLDAGTHLVLDGASLCTVTSIHSGAGLLKAVRQGQSISADPVGIWNGFFSHFRSLHQSLEIPDIYIQTEESSKMTLLRLLTANHLPEPMMIQSFVQETIEKIDRRAESYGLERYPKIKAYLDDPVFKQYFWKVKARDSAAQDMDIFLFFCQMAMDVLDYHLPRPRGSFFGNVGQRIFGTSQGYDIVDYIASMVQTFLRNRVVFKTDNGLIGLGPEYMAVGDQVWDLLGGSVPYILRKTAGDHGREFSLVGECYVHGIMNGELWRDSTTDNARHLHGRSLSFEKIKLV
jgi:hypothetical protein